MIATQSSPASGVLAGCQVGANPIIWSNDDFHDLAGDLPLEVILSEMRTAGFAGSELGHAYPRTTTALGDALGRYQLKLVSGWHSTYLAQKEYAAEEAGFRKHLALLKSLGAAVVIVAECSHCIHGNKDAPLGFGSHDRPRLTEAEWPRVCGGLEKFAALSAAEGLKLVYHHHMGTVIQSEGELERLLAAVPSLHLLLDPGHLAFAGIDPLGVAKRHGARIAHVHLKSVRREVAERMRRERGSFYRAVREGVFTVLGKHGYRGWLVVEAEEDPVQVPALPKARKARDYVRVHTGA